MSTGAHPDRGDLAADGSDEVVAALASGQQTTWFRHDLPPSADVLAVIDVDSRVMDAAAERFARFAPWFAETFPEVPDGIIESPLVEAASARDHLGARLGAALPGRLWLKRDDALPVSGSIKARGGFHEVLEFAEAVAAAAGFDTADAAVYSSGAFRAIARDRTVIVGSTGNLGLSIGILAAALGFACTVHMSADAREWKKEKLRTHGVEVIEHEGDFVAAVAAGRTAAASDPSAHFVDDEDSVSLFAGYSVAALRLRDQLAAAAVTVDADHPLVVYLPCGIGGGPGGVTFGLKRIFGDSVHCVFVEPAHAPAMFLGVRTGLHSGIAVQDIGLSGATIADGLAVARPSRFIGPRIGPLISGFASVDDEVITAGVGVLADAEGIAVEPSATAGLSVPWRATTVDAPWPMGETTTHLVWLTGGAMVPRSERDHYLAAARAVPEDIAGPWR
ncbi:D-serine ammonia-lyase [Brevibacterium casei]|uniref:Probable D-serine dehydratase n=2 Tax=Brevibacterium casei TaxID=33889 RepID=A0A2H1IYH6_9MICO|nr:D-serine ammonia-lyase [Brevibacterium casei]MCT1549465.1 D-serine ammonia-lyase [Brevibacterium casei]MCT1561344.1 D-serine ammonia-lyase [Brevibacterium casei]MCT2208532.1 D-serine ammonia-lyase [Brevibacterium casei]QPR39525.1 D-serine ammonia-lyase [Brevibacterium casei]QPR43690.1 D-serine ammonia-lyase [Brevibacterium casei]